MSNNLTRAYGTTGNLVRLDGTTGHLMRGPLVARPSFYCESLGYWLGVLSGYLESGNSEWNPTTRTLTFELNLSEGDEEGVDFSSFASLLLAPKWGSVAAYILIPDSDPEESILTITADIHVLCTITFSEDMDYATLTYYESVTVGSSYPDYLTPSGNKAETTLVYEGSLTRDENNVLIGLLEKTSQAIDDDDIVWRAGEPEESPLLFSVEQAYLDEDFSLEISNWPEP